jgi:hypothetical protein
MLQDCSRADLMRNLPGMGADFQRLTERAKRLSRYLGCVIRTGVGDYHDPQRVVPAGMAVGGKYAGNALRDCPGLIVRRYDNPDCLDFRW